MKLAIYGDWAGENNDILSWIDFLSNIHKIDIFAVQGSSLYFSYIKFLETHVQYDKIIFLVPSPGSIWLKNCTVQEHIANFDSADHWLKNCSTYTDEMILKSAKKYFEYVQNKHFDFVIQKLILEEIKETRKDAFFIDFSKANGSFEIPSLEIEK